MKTLIIGATGQIGKMTTEKMLASGHDVVALVRDKSKLSRLESSHLTIVEQDLENDFSRAFEGVEQVIFSAGSGGSTGADKTLLIDLWAAVKAINYAVDAKVKHFIIVSSIGADAPDNIESSIKPYLVAKHMADQHLINSELNYSIVRPGTLKNDAATGLLTTTRPATRQDAVINREDVADTLLYLAEHTPKKPQVFELFNGDKSIDSLLND
ncbi:SDR family oxidoreductase [Pseudoalteromonas sp. MEBiC 03485]|uniref:SDR family oxidoreductase n=1 Tax=Pseudoalteromonas sp. MEBiC 03485 TaxID=2571103 RepID=UPI00101F21C4|nr:SDR family oxidoreductase [Pseudoalteromonas sp. MEBiC 03485]RZD22411.1 SDR family oxidoreductase [Pseudoalteromonas sp. MEBiC 03485]